MRVHKGGSVGVEIREIGLWSSVRLKECECNSGGGRSLFFLDGELSLSIAFGSVCAARSGDALRVAASVGRPVTVTSGGAVAAVRSSFASASPAIPSSAAPPVDPVLPPGTLL